ncbi:MAG TPA: hypothetical protein PLG72_00995 [Clostridiales bacterium]|nr:hypothetical protein [Clostridiales bacterium]HOL90932.1 hypothetical protein [Clostridiales bacterium]
MVGPLTANHRKIEESVEKHADMLLRVAFMYMKNLSDAEDIVQGFRLKLLFTQNQRDNCDHKAYESKS